MDEQQLQQAIDKANETFRENQCNLYAEPTLKGNLVTIKIEWGDWKHEHGYADYVMQQNGFVKVGEQDYEEDGSDCYSSTHVYYYNRVLAFMQRNSSNNDD